jgi:hypothetical protein
MRPAVPTAVSILCLLTGIDGWAEDIGGQGVLRELSIGALHTILPADTHVMVESSAIEQFLAELDGDPPDWQTLYGHGHHDPGHDDRVFSLNRERDAKREGRPALSWRLAFVWAGELSPYKFELGGFPVALGPKFIKTKWGMVRFKPEEAPSNLVAIVDVLQRDRLQKELAAGKTVEVDVVMTGQLIPEESLVYDFSHDEEGVGLIMPFVRIERVDFVMAP